jgi:hypothetical protein
MLVASSPIHAMLLAESIRLMQKEMLRGSEELAE